MGICFNFKCEGLLATLVQRVGSVFGVMCGRWGWDWQNGWMGLVVAGGWVFGGVFLEMPVNIQRQNLNPKLSSRRSLVL